MIPIYVVSYNRPDRRDRMMQRFNTLHIDHMVTFTPEVHSSDSRLQTLEESQKRNASIMLQHLDSLRLFLSTDSDYCIVCEDDIHISKSFTEKLPTILYDVKVMKVDVMMIGYILTFQIDMNTTFHQGYFSYTFNDKNHICMSSHTYHSYPDDIWGTQMYMISRSYAAYLLDTYSSPSLYKSLQSYNPDWIITKPKVDSEFKRSLIYPMLALEEKNISGQNYDYTKQYHAHYNDTFL